MKIDLRSNLQHMGDIFVGAVQKTADSTIAYSKSVFLTYVRNSLHSRKKKVASEIIERVTVLIKEGKSDVCRDATLVGLVTKLNGIENDITGYSKQKAEPDSPFTSILVKSGWSTSIMKKK
ncbi:MAG: hypothetical protein WCP20_21355 [Desulfuromonadales bacterium]